MKGKLLAKGEGVRDMMNICYRRGWSERTTILEVDDYNDLDSAWRIYGRVELSGEEA